MQYRKAVAGEAPVIADFQIKMAWETENVRLDPAICLRGVEAVFINAHLGCYYVCAIDQQVVGSLLITTEWSDWRSGCFWWIQSVYIKPEFRGRGVYSQLYAYIKELAATDSAVRGIRLYVDQTNQKAQAVYTKLGMNGEHYRVFEWMK